MNPKLLLPALSLFLLLTDTLQAQPTTFSYQGRLAADGAPANGAYEMRFSLYDSLVSITPRAGPISLPSVAVSNGVFTVPLNFGAPFNAMDSPALEIEVRPAGSGAAFTRITPRQSVTPTPYALRAFTADTVTGTLADNKLSANIARLNAHQTFTGNLNLNGPGNVGIGTTTPTERLDVNGNIKLSGDLLVSPPGDLNFGAATRQMINLWGTAYGIGVQANTLYQRSDNNFAWFRDGVHNDNAGQPGTGGSNLMTLNAEGDLFVNKSLTLDNPGANNGELRPGLLFASGSGEGIASKRTPGGNRYGIDFYTGFLNRMSILNNGNIGIGTTQPEHLLDVNGNFAVRGSVVVDSQNQNNGTDIPGIIFGDYGSVEVISSQRGTNGPNRFGLDLYTANNRRLSIANNGNVGIGVASPQGKLDVETGNGRIQFINDGVPGINVTGGSLPGVLRFRNSLEVWPSLDGSRAGHLDVRDSDGTPRITLRGNGTATIKVLEITGGADIAEPFPMREEDIKPGAVVVIDAAHPGRLRRSTRAYDTRVAGIVSGANGIRPGLALHQEGRLEGGQNVALTGRVYALADAGSDPIQPGDLLTTSDTPGHVMKVADRERGHGAILGKAMTALPNGRGHVLVLVSLQ